MSSFAADWLALREPVDAASRAPALRPFLVAALAAAQSRPAGLAVIDLGAGTGANLRYAAPLLGGRQDWLLVERDPVLLDAVAGRMRAWPQASQAPLSARGQWLAAEGRPATISGAGFECHVRTRTLDLATQLQQLPLPDGALLTASALLDLVSEDWLRTLLRRAAAAAAMVWFALTYDGQIDCHPAEPDDAAVRELFNQHQLGDKGFGGALGPGAARMAEQILAEHGYRVQCAPSDWCIGPEQSALQHALVEGWFDAVCEIAPLGVAAWRSWLARRRSHIDGSRSELRVGHVDMVACPPPRGAACVSRSQGAIHHADP